MYIFYFNLFILVTFIIITYNSDIFYISAGKDLINLAVAKTEHQVQWQELSQFMQTQSGLCTLHNSSLNFS